MTSKSINATVSQYAPTVQKPNFTTGFTPYYAAYAREPIGPVGGELGFMQVVSDVTALQEDKSYLLTVTEGSEMNAYGVTKGITPNTQRYGIVNMQIVMKVPADYDFTAVSALKFFRLKTETAAGTNRGYADTYIKANGEIYYIHEAIPMSGVDAISGYAIQRDAWETFEYRVAFDTVAKDDGGEGRATLWIKRGNDFVKIIDQTSKPTLAAADDKNSLALIFTYWNGFVPQDQTMNIQRVVIETDQSKMFAIADGMKIIGGEYVNA